MPKKGENIYKRKDGRWEARYIKSRNKDGKIHYGYVYASTYKEAKHKCVLVRMEMEANKEKENIHVKRQNFSYWAELWMTAKKSSIKISSYNKYYNLLHLYILPYIGETEICEVTIVVLEDMILKLKSYPGKRKAGLSEKSIADIISVIKNIMKYATKMDPLLQLQTINVEIKQKSQELIVLTRENQTVLTDYLIEHWNRKNAGVLLCLYTGIRIGELCALKRQNISIENGFIHICSTMQRVQNKNTNHPDEPKTVIQIMSPKSSASIRQIPLPENIRILFSQYADSKDDTFFLTGENNRFLEPRVMQYHFKKILKECNLTEIKFHALRHYVELYISGIPMFLS